MPAQNHNEVSQTSTQGSKEDEEIDLADLTAVEQENQGLHRRTTMQILIEDHKRLTKALDRG